VIDTRTDRVIDTRTDRVIDTDALHRVRVFVRGRKGDKGIDGVKERVQDTLHYTQPSESAPHIALHTALLTKG